MAWIEGTEEQTFVVNAAYAEVVEFFNDPSLFKECLSQIERAEEVDDMVWRWVLEEKSAKGISYQADYTVKYETNGEGKGTWHTLEGNMRSEGEVECKEVGQGRTQVHYKETIATDLPIPKLMAKVFRPIVAREIRKGVGNFLDCARARFDS